MERHPGNARIESYISRCKSQVNRAGIGLLNHFRWQSKPFLPYLESTNYLYSSSEYLLASYSSFNAQQHFHHINDDCVCVRLYEEPIYIRAEGKTDFILEQLETCMHWVIKSLLVGTIFPISEFSYRSRLCTFMSTCFCDFGVEVSILSTSAIRS